MQEMDEIREKLGIIEDTRHPGYVKHDLVDVLIVVMCAVMCGLDELGDILLFGQNRQELLRKHFGIEKIPSKATLSRILNMVDGEAVGNVMVNIMREDANSLGGVVAVDGKAIRSTAKERRPQSALQILTAYATESGVVLGQQSIHEKTNEIPVFQEMLELLDVEGKTITADAMHCQKETCRKIVEQKGAYVFGLKGNQPTLFKDVELFFGDASTKDGVQTHSMLEKNAGRIEKRICRKIVDLSWLEERHRWPGLRSVFSIQRIVDARGHHSDETCYYISSLDASPERLMGVAREHWKIESLHWLLDVTFSEDECHLLSENGHKTLNAFRKLALLAHKRYLSSHCKKSSIKSHLLTALLNFDLLLSVLACL
jgi:predicted transposase YbfD/YdcC